MYVVIDLLMQLLDGWMIGEECGIWCKNGLCGGGWFWSNGYKFGVFGCSGCDGCAGAGPFSVLYFRSLTYGKGQCHGPASWGKIL